MPCPHRTIEGEGSIFGGRCATWPQTAKADGRRSDPARRGDGARRAGRARLPARGYLAHDYADRGRRQDLVGGVRGHFVAHGGIEPGRENCRMVRYCVTCRSPGTRRTTAIARLLRAVTPRCIGADFSRRSTTERRRPALRKSRRACRPRRWRPSRWSRWRGRKPDRAPCWRPRFLRRSAAAATPGGRC